MKSILIVAFLSLIMLFAGTVQAEEKKSCGKGKPTVSKTVSKHRGSTHSRSHFGLKLTDEQKAKIKKIMEDAKKKIMEEVLTDAQRKQLADGKKKMEAKKAEYAKKRSEFMKKFDKNGDGKLDEAERKAMKESFGKRMPDKRRRTKK
jgi:Spy/CpxP family protein refolding chaperone